MMQPLVSTVKINKVTVEGDTETDDLLAVEEPLEIRIGFGAKNNREQKNISVTMRTPGHDFELATGFLFTEGIIRHFDDIATISYCSNKNGLQNQGNIVRVELKPHVKFDLSLIQRNFYATSSCGVCGKASIESVKTIVHSEVHESLWKVEKNVILSLPAKLRSSQNVFEYTGGLHACALFDLNGNLELVREDVGRHNALDKLIGAVLGKMNSINKNSISFNDSILLLSGRASFELIQKSAMAGIQLVCAVGAPSSLAVEMAKQFNMTLVGFLRDQRFNIYSNENRISV